MQITSARFCSNRILCPFFAVSNRVLFIVNPFSGKRIGEKTAKTIAEKLSHNSAVSEIFVSHNLTELNAFVGSTNLNDFGWIGIIGGDGTMHGFMNAALNAYGSVNPPLALFPCGTGNAFNFDIGCATVDETLACVLQNRTSYIDVAEVTYENGERLWSFNILGCGLVADINRLAEKWRWLGGMRYNVASVIKLLGNPVQEYEITTDNDRFSGKYSFMLACNTRYTGKGMMMAPHAELNDGKFDIILVKACSAFKLLTLFPKIFKGQHLGADVLSYLQTSSLSIISKNGPQQSNIDGEMKGQTPFRFIVHKNKVRVFVK